MCMPNLERYTVSEKAAPDKPVIPLVMVLANKLINELDFTSRINEGVEAEAAAWSVDPGRLIKALVLSTFIDMRAPLSHVAGRLSGFDIEWLLDKKGVLAEELNAFSIGRALERLGKADSDGIYEALALDAVIQNGIPLNRLHSDTSTVSFYGDYDIDAIAAGLGLSESEKEEILKIERGYNKDGRPDCAQIVVGQIVSDTGIPLISRAMDGSTSDAEWNKLAATYLDNIIEAGFDGFYVADSKLVFEESIKGLLNKEKPIKFVSRVPSNFEKRLEARTIKKAYAANAWDDLGKFTEGEKAAVYRCSSYDVELYGGDVCLLALESSILVYKAQISLEKNADKADKDLKKLQDKVFHSDKDAQSEMGGFVKKWPCFDYGLSIEKETKIKFPKGRRKRGAAGTEITTYHVRPQYISWNTGACLDYLHNESCIVLITNAVDGYTDSEILQIYKKQQTVENSFKILKEPQLASVIFLKNPDRVKGLMMALSFSLLIRAIIQHKLRQGLAEYKSQNNGIPPNVGWNDRPLENPTYKLLYEHAYNCRFTKENDGVYSFFWGGDAAKKRVSTLLQLMGYTVNELLEL